MELRTDEIGLEGVLGKLDGGIMDVLVHGLVNVSTDLDTSPFFSVLIRIIDERLQPEFMIDSSGRDKSMKFLVGPGVWSKNSFASIHCSIALPSSNSN